MKLRNNPLSPFQEGIVCSVIKVEKYSSEELLSLKTCRNSPLKRGTKGVVLEYRINVQIQIILIINSLDSIVLNIIDNS